MGLVLIWLTPRMIEAKSGGDRSIIEDIRGGLGVMRAHEFLPGLLVVTIIFNLFGYPFISMVPVVAKDILELNDFLTGILSSAEGAGALLGAIVLSLFVNTAHSRYYYAFSVMAFCFFAVLFSMSTELYLSFGMLFLVGLVSAAFGSMQTALVLMNAPEGYERQMMGILSVCIGTAPIGFLHIGFLANQFGPAKACIIVAVVGFLAMIFAVWRWPKLLSAQPT